MLAASLEGVELPSLSYPLLASPKVDGIRCLVSPTLGVLSRSFKNIPNEHIADTLMAAEAWYLDGELITFSGSSPDSFNTIQSKVMSHKGKPKFLFLVFDYFEVPSTAFSTRYTLARWKASHIEAPCVQSLTHKTVYSDVEILAEETRALASGFEGLMLRHPDRPYKSGRSTLTELGLLKLKRFSTSEGRVVGLRPLERNLNPQERSELGLAKRSSHKANKLQDSILGSLVLSLPDGQTLSVGSGFTLAQRADIWSAPDDYIGRLVTYKYLPHGTKTLPRHPIFIGFRHEDDL
jgi:DNA ligase-1